MKTGPGNKLQLCLLADDTGLRLIYTVRNFATGELVMPEYYEIKIKGHLDAHWSEWMAGLVLTHLPGKETLLAGFLPDQVALHGQLERIRDLNLKLISVTSGGWQPYQDAGGSET